LGNYVTESFFLAIVCAYPLQKGNQDSINKLSKGEYRHGWHKAMDILKQVGHLLFGSTEIQQRNNNDKIKGH
jgi:hypothetical protein